MKLQGKVEIENQRKANSEKNTTLTRSVRLFELQKRFCIQHEQTYMRKLNNTSETDTKNNTSLTGVLTR